MRKLATERSKTLTADQVEKLKTNARGILSQARKTVLDRFPFVGTVAMGLDLVPTRDCRISTMATDGAAIYCDIDFLSRLSNDDKVFILAHEVYHNVMMHPIRRGSRKPELFNLATDMEVNDILREDGLSVPADAVLPEKYGFARKQNAEAYYEQLLQREQRQAQYQSGGDGYDGAGSGSMDDNADNADNSSESTSTSESTSGNKDGELKGQFDKHISKDDPREEKGPENMADSYGKVGYDSDYRPEVTESAVERVRESAVTAAQVIMRQGGDLPGHLQKIVNELLEPKLDWREELAKFLTKTAGDQNRTWNQCNRRFIGSKLYLPSSYSNNVKIGVVIDTSGSVEKLANKFLSEVNGIVTQFNGYSIDLLQCDVRVTKADHYDENEPLDLEHMKYEIHGGGGTRLTPALKWFDENAPEVECIVVFTDCECEEMTPENAPNAPVLWISTIKGEHSNIQFGDIVDFDVNG